MHNDDESGPQSAIGGQAGFAAGEYYLGISAFNADPLDAGAGAIFQNAITFPGPLLQQRAPAGGSGALNSWTTSSGTGGYTIALSGVAPIPAPGSVMLALFGLGGLALIRRR